MSRTYIINATEIWNKGAPNHTPSINDDFNSYYAAAGIDGDAAYLGYIENSGRNTYILGCFGFTVQSSILSHNIEKIALKVTVGRIAGRDILGSCVFRAGKTASRYARIDTETAVNKTISALGEIEFDLTDAGKTVSNDMLFYEVGTGQVIVSNNVLYALSQNGNPKLEITTAEEQITLGFNANGGNGGPATQTVWAEGSYSFTIPTTTPTRTGYAFTGWNTSADGSGTPYSAGASITVYDNTTLYAQWSALKSTITSVGDGETGTSILVEWNAKGSFAHTLFFSFGNASVTGVQVAAGTNQYRFTIPTAWNAQLPTTTSGTATVTLTTIADGTDIGTDSDTFTVSVPSSVVPSIGTLSAEKVNTNPTVEEWDIYLQSFSQVKLTASSLAAGAGASITSVRFTGLDCDVTDYSGDTSAEATSFVITGSGSQTYTALITDSRGRTATRTVTINVTQYSKPTVSFFYGWRCDADGTTNPVTGESLSAQVRYSYTQINGNTITNTLSYKKTTETNWITAFTDVATGAYKVFAIDAADMASTYDLQFTITDTLQNTTTVYAKVSSVVGIAFGLKNDRARFGGACRQSGLEIDWQTQIDNRLSIKTDNAYPFRVLNANGDKALDMINYNGAAQFSMYDTGVERNYIGQGRFSTYDSTGQEVDRVSQGGSFFGSDVTFKGVVDVTQRRCFALLQSAGWYRVMNVDAIARGANPFVIDLSIGRNYTNSNAEFHEIKLFVNYDSFSFTQEISKSNAFGIEKIRYIRDSTWNGYIDIYYSLNTSNTVYVDFTVHSRPTQYGRFTAASLESVADAPSGETVLTTHDFSANYSPSLETIYASNQTYSKIKNLSVDVMVENRLVLSSVSPVYIPFGYSAAFLLVGFLQGVGGVVLGVTRTASTLKVRDLMTNTDFSSIYVSFSIDGNNIKITSTVQNESIISIYRGGQ